MNAQFEKFFSEVVSELDKSDCPPFSVNVCKQWTRHGWDERNKALVISDKKCEKLTKINQVLTTALNKLTEKKSAYCFEHTVKGDALIEIDKINRGE